MPIKSLHSLVPDASALLNLDETQLAHTLLTCLLTLNEDHLNLFNLTREGQFSRGFPAEFHDTINRAIAGSWAWLQGRGYLAQRPGSMTSDWMVVTPQGRRWFETYERSGISAPENEALEKRTAHSRWTMSSTGLDLTESLGTVDVSDVRASSEPFSVASEPQYRANSGKVRINDLARSLEVKSRHILDVLAELGIGEGKTHSSSILESEAEQVRAHLQRVGQIPERLPRSARPKVDLSHLSNPGDVMKAILAKKKEQENQDRERLKRDASTGQSQLVRGTPGYTSEFCGLGGDNPVADYLYVEKFANRLAELIILRETKLPLAIGLFGNWGSGKSHFMNLMDRRMRALCLEQESQIAVGSGEKRWCSKIVPIYFNAWHYSDSNLWASLVTQVFEGLFEHLRGKEELKDLRVRL